MSSQWQPKIETFEKVSIDFYISEVNESFVC